MFRSNSRKWLSAVMITSGLAWVLWQTPVARAEDQSQDKRKVVSMITAAYPELAKKMRVTGVVKLEVTVTPAGTVKGTHVIGGHPLLVDSAVEAVKRWKYASASSETTELVVFNFTGAQ